MAMNDASREPSADELDDYEALPESCGRQFGPGLSLMCGGTVGAWPNRGTLICPQCAARSALLAAYRRKAEECELLREKYEPPSGPARCSYGNGLQGG